MSYERLSEPFPKHRGTQMNMATIAAVRFWAEALLGASASVLVIVRDETGTHISLRFRLEHAMAEIDAAALVAVKRLSAEKAVKAQMLREQCRYALTP